jgi:2-haloalkanoic acid dehalogenase type II
MKLTDFKVLTFDCYGTLIDWETGILNGLAPLAARVRPAMPPDQLLEQFAQHESDQQQQTPAMLYSQLLSVVYRRLANAWAIAATDEEANSFGASIADWPAFPDSAEALQYLGQYYKLVILSNVDRRSFRASNVRLKVSFGAIFTAEDIGSYKPDDRNFAYLLAQLQQDYGFGKAAILHVAQSLFHDHAPANRAGLASAWIDRRHAVGGRGATMPPPAAPRYDFRFESMAAFAASHKQEIGDGT